MFEKNRFQTIFAKKVWTIFKNTALFPRFGDCPQFCPPPPLPHSMLVAILIVQIAGLKMPTNFILLISTLKGEGGRECYRAGLKGLEK